jgi:hypothetical protein
MADVNASINYLVPQSEPLHTYAFDPPDGSPRFNGRLESREVRIRDARVDGPHADLFVTGFALVDHVSRVRAFWDEPELRSVYFPEAEQLVREATGLREAYVFDSTLRRRSQGQAAVDGVGGSFASVREPVGRVHADFTPRSAPARIERDLPNVASRALAGDYLIVGLWRSIGAAPVRDAPLAVADARSVTADNLVPNALVYPDRRGETYAIVHSDRHRWYYYSDQMRDEALLFVHYDSRRGCLSGNASTGAVAHTAFDLSDRPDRVPPRESVELRILAF